MDPDTQPPKRRDNVISSLNMAIEVLNIAKDVMSHTPAKAVFGSVSALLVMIRDSMANEADFVALGLTCAEICTAIKEGMDGKKESDLNEPVRKAIERLERVVKKIASEIKSKTKRRGKLRTFLRSLFHAKNEKEVIAGWTSDLNIILGVFNTQLSINNHVIVSDVNHNVIELRRDVSGLRRDVSQTRRRNEEQIQSVQVSSPGESPPPPPRVLFGRDELVEKIVDLVDNLTPIALLGAGGIGKTSVALTVLHHDRIKERFGDDRRFIRCDQFPATQTHFLRRLSEAIGARVDNPEDLTLLRPFLSSKEILIVLDNAESILDPQGMDAEGIYAVVEELSQLGNICLCVTSRISTIPPECKTLNIPTLSIDAARNTFYRIYEYGERSDLVNDILQQLDFHPLSITLLATVAHHNKWGTDRLIKEWERRRTDVLHTHHNKSLAATIELSLASPMFQDLGPNARDLLGVVAFFPQGVDENNLDWLFPTIPNRTDIFDKFCILSLTYRSNEYATMLAPLRDYLRPKDPKSSPLLCSTKDRYFSRLSVDIDPDEPSTEETRWITSEDVNVEHLLDVFTSIDASSGDVWNACANFMAHLKCHKARSVVLGLKVEGLPEDHPSKPQCLYELSHLRDLVGNLVEGKLLLLHALKLWRERGDDLNVAQTLDALASGDLSMGNNTEAMRHAKEALEIYERLNDTAGQADSLQSLALAFANDNQLDAAEKAANRAINLHSGEPKPSRVCFHHYILAQIRYSQGETEAAISHYDTALEIASSSNLQGHQAFICQALVGTLLKQERFEDVQVYLERLKSHTVNYPLLLGIAMTVQAQLCRQQGKYEEAKSAILQTIDTFEKIGASEDLIENSRELLRDIEGRINNAATSD